MDFLTGCVVGVVVTAVVIVVVFVRVLCSIDKSVDKFTFLLFSDLHIGGEFYFARRLHRKITTTEYIDVMTGCVFTSDSDTPVKVVR